MDKRPFFVIIFTVFLLLPLMALADESSSVFPLWRSLAGDEELPLPFGVGVHYYTQEQNYVVDRLGVTGFDLSTVGNIDIKNNLNEQDLEFDLWMFPFLNVFVLVGNVDGKTKVKLMDPLPDMTIGYNGWVYGAGLTFVYGYKRYFGTLCGTYSATNLDAADSSISAWVLTPKVGFSVQPGKFVHDLQFWGGATRQQAAEKHKGMITIPGLGQVGYDVELHQEKAWNYGIGMELGFTENWRFYVDAGFKERKHIDAAFVYRFGKLHNL